MNAVNEEMPLDSGLRERALFDPASRVQRRFGASDDTVVLVRPDGHVAAIVPFDSAGDDVVGSIYTTITGTARPVRPVGGTA